MTTYRITEWTERYEVDDHGGVWKPGSTRRAGPLTHIRLKVHGRSQGVGWRKLLRAVGPRRAPAIFGIFAKLLEIAGDAKCESRGLFTLGGEESADFILGLDRRDIENAVSVLCQIGWIQPVEEIPGISGNSPELREIPNQISPDQIIPPIVPQRDDGDELFLRFWQAYPKKVAKDAARKAFAKRKPSEALLATMLAAIFAQKRVDSWTRENGRYIPNPASWLNGGRWEDHTEAEIIAFDGHKCRCGKPADGRSTDDTGQDWYWCRTCQPKLWEKHHATA